MPGVESLFGVPEYQISGSVRFEDGDSAALNFTPQTASNRRTWTYSTWFKRGNINSSGTRGVLFSAYEDSANYTYIGFDDGGGGYDRLRVYSLTSSSVAIDFESTAQLRDVSAWYHLVVSVDTTQGTSGNRVKIYLNGEQVTDWATSTEPSQNYDTFVSSILLHSVGSYNNASSYYDGYIAETNLVDGSQLTPSSFAETNEMTGQWIPIQYAGAYGTTGFYLPFTPIDALATATGGTITTDGDFKVHKFTSNGTYVLSAPDNGFAEVDILIVGGGGNAPGGSSSLGGGGGGGGGLYYKTGTSLAAGSYSVVVGAASADSSFAGITALAGGDGGSQNAGQAGGSGGGGVGNAAAGATSNNTQGFAGGIGLGTIGSSVCSGGGGGGAGGVGTNSADNATGNTLSFSDGGAGLAIDIVAASTNVTYAAGGKGADHDSSTDGVDGAANTGTGASGGGGSGGGAGTGGTGIVVIRHKFQ